MLTLGGLVLMLSARPVRDEAVPRTRHRRRRRHSKIVAVTVYPNSALVTREVDVPAGTGIVELVVHAAAAAHRSTARSIPKAPTASAS